MGEVVDIGDVAVYKLRKLQAECDADDPIPDWRVASGAIIDAIMAGVDLKDIINAYFDSGSAREIEINMWKNYKEPPQPVDTPPT